MEELRKDVETTSQVMPHSLGHQQQVAAAAAMAASVLASRNAAMASMGAAGKVYAPGPLDLHR